MSDWKHGHASTRTRLATPTYAAWANMRYRCNTPSCHAYDYYGGRGIKVCDRWNSFENFLQDMGEKPDGLSLDRIDNNGDYTPENCRWASAYTQMKNRRKTLLRGFGLELPIAEWANIAGVSLSTFDKRLRAGWSLTRAVLE